VHTLQLFEWEKGTQKSPFSESELRILKKFNDSIQRAEKTNALTVTYGKIYTYSFVGVIQIGKKRIEILPKLFNPEINVAINTLSEAEREKLTKTARKNLFSLLSFAGLIPYYKTEISQYGKEKDFFEFLIALFLTDLETVIGPHFHHEYISQSDDLTHIKGKLNFQQQAVKLPSQLHTFSCTFDEFSIDNPLNRLIKATLQKIQELCKNEDNKKRAFNFHSLMHEIQDEVILPSYLSKLHFNRLNEDFKGIVEFCFMILFGSTYSVEEGPHSYYALIFDMNLVFEKYVTKLLRHSLQEFTFHYQDDFYLASDHHPVFQYIRNKKRLIPDIIVRENGASIAIIDTKYKPDLSKGYISNADTYQMMAYCVANESDKALLLYPKLPVQDELKEREHLIVLDKLEKEKKKDRLIHIYARSIQLIESNGKILKKLTQDDADTIRTLLNNQINRESNRG
jgi:5-methylcytosine-specific restriction enzyme subunit McrC